MQCTACGAMNNEKSRFCLDCGARLDEQLADAQPAPAATGQPASGRPANCPTCNVALDGTERYCRNCGSYIGSGAAASGGPAPVPVAPSAWTPADELPRAPAVSPAEYARSSAPSGEPVAASFGQRIGASAIDLLVAVGILFVATMVVAIPVVFSTGAENVNDLTDDELNQMSGIAYALALGGFIVYSMIFEMASGATLGKKAMGLTVRTADGQRVGLGTALARAVLRPLFTFFLIGYLIIPFNRNRQALYDMATSTVVFRRDSVSA